ncbi:hypothetical protein EAH87_07450 [Sphingomonas koreensis]|nr:hypothetical protein EAH87_07450 [Sphingomonas koreensis]
MTTFSSGWRDGFAAEGAAAAREANALIIADDPVAGLTAADAVAHAGGRAFATLRWQDAADTLGTHAVIDWIVIEAQHVAIDDVAAVLPRIDTLARATDARIVAALDFEQIDLFAATVLADRAALLCAPTLAERVAALAIAAPRGADVQERSREAETDRLRRLNEEVARIAETLARLTRDDAEPAPAPESVGDRRPPYGAGPAGPGVPVSARDIRQAIKSRRLRDQFFQRGLFEDPAWDMLLDLFAAELEDVAVSVSSLCIAAAVAPTTALRWIAKLTDAGLLDRRPDPFDKRRAFMVLSDTARAGIVAYCAAIKQAGLAIA